MTTITNITDAIHILRGVAVLLDRDLALVYGVETRVLKQAVRRNRERFPEDFMFELKPEEIKAMVSQNVIPNQHKMTPEDNIKIMKK